LQALRWSSDVEFLEGEGFARASGKGWVDMRTRLRKCVEKDWAIKTRKGVDKRVGTGGKRKLKFTGVVSVVGGAVVGARWPYETKIEDRIPMDLDY